MLDGLFLTSTVSAIRAALASADTDGDVIVVGDLKLGKSLRQEGVKAVLVATGKSPKGATDAVAGALDKLPLPDHGAGALVGVGAASRDDAAAILTEWCRTVRDGGAVILVDRGAATDATRLALCAGLTELEQRTAGRFTITSGLVTSL